jgi:Trk K+ transport system NAD-binding subunit
MVDSGQKPKRRQGKAVSRRTRMSTTSTAAGGRAPSGHRRRDLLRYRFDNALGRGPLVVIAYLALLSLAIVLLTAVIAALAQFRFGGSSSDTFTEDVWQAMLRTVDAGSFAADSAWPTRLLAFGTTLAGIFLAGSLIGLIANAVDQKVEDLRRGRSAVIEDGHTVILGWSAQVPRIIGELVIANDSERSAAIVVLARADKTEMEEELRDRVPDLRTTHVVCRTGNPSVPDDLRRAAIGVARSIVVVRDSDGDAGVVKAVLAVRVIDPELEQAHVVAELQDKDNARILRSVTKGRVLTVSSDDVVAEVTAQACLQGGLAGVFQDLLDFDGDEIYFVPAAGLSGHSYADVQLAFETSSLIGRLTGDGIVELNPEPETTIAHDDELIVVAADDSTATVTGLRSVTPPAPASLEAPVMPPGHIVVVGWSDFGAKVLRELDEFLPDGSRIDMVVDADLVDADRIEATPLHHARLTVRRGDGGPGDLAPLIAGPPPQQIIVLGYRDALSVDDADARTLLTLIPLRQTWPAGPGAVRIVAELLDQRNLVLADPVGVDDLIVSDALSSLLMAQLSERVELQAVFDDLFDAEGAVVELHPAGLYAPVSEVTFADVVANGARRCTSPFGYRVGATGEIVMNPPKSARVTLGDGDEIIVVATRS